MFYKNTFSTFQTIECRVSYSLKMYLMLSERERGGEISRDIERERQQHCKLSDGASRGLWYLYLSVCLRPLQPPVERFKTERFVDSLTSCRRRSRRWFPFCQARSWLDSQFSARLEMGEWKPNKIPIKILFAAH